MNDDEEEETLHILMEECAVGQGQSGVKRGEMQKFLLTNEGCIWTRSYSVNGSKSDMQLREGTPPEATHIIGERKYYRFHVSYYNPAASDEEVELEYDKAIPF